MLNTLKKKYIPMSETMLYILFSLREKRHGYAIMQFVFELTDERIKLGAGTVYQSLAKLRRDGLISECSGGENRREYIITPIGQEILKIEAERIVSVYNTIKGLV